MLATEIVIGRTAPASSCALASSTARRNGTGSISNSSSPCLTIWPSLTTTLLDLAGDVGRHQHLLRADIGVVGADVAAAIEIEARSRRSRRRSAARPAAGSGDSGAGRPSGGGAVRCRPSWSGLPLSTLLLGLEFEDRISHSAAPYALVPLADVWIALRTFSLMVSSWVRRRWASAGLMPSSAVAVSSELQPAQLAEQLPPGLAADRAG